MRHDRASTSRGLLLLASLLGLSTAELAAQEEISYEFTRVAGIFELRDGRVLVVDRGAALVLLADFATKRVIQVGRQGAGPREYREPFALYPLGGDSAVIFDNANVRLLVVRPNGELGGVVSPFSPSRQAGIQASDGNGRFYGEGRIQGERRQAIPIVRWSLDAGSERVVGEIPVVIPQGSLQSEGVLVAAPGEALAPPTRNLWAVSRQGTLAIAHYDPYRVTFQTESHGTIVGPSLAYPRIALTDSMKTAFLSERLSSNTALVISEQNRSSTRSSALPLGSVRWRNHVPSFRGDALVLFDLNETLWLQRTTFGSEGGRYDRFMSVGTLQDTLRLPAGHIVVGFGKNHMYVIRVDRDGLQRLQRRVLPRR